MRFFCATASLVFLTSLLLTTLATAQSTQKIALLPNVSGYDTGRESVGVSDFSQFQARSVYIGKASFVSPTFLPELHPRWIFNWGENIGWHPVDEVLRGREVYQAWVDTLSYGVVCQPSDHNEMPFLRPSLSTETCAYTSRENTAEGEPSIFYCVFWRAGKVDSDRQCEIVALTTEGQEAVLSVSEGTLPSRGAGGEAFWYCLFPNVAPEAVAPKIGKLMSLLTEESGVSFVNNIGNRYLVGAQAMNLSGYHDQYFVKLSVMGDITKFENADASYASTGPTGFDPSAVQELGSGSMFAYYRSFTVSPRFTTSVIDYREPSGFVEDGIVNTYGQKVVDFYEEHFPGFECQFFLI